MLKSLRERGASLRPVTARESLAARLSTMLFRGLGASTDREMAALTVLLGLAVANATLLVAMVGDHIWIVDAQGHPLVRGFVTFWAAGRQALGGHVLAVYDPGLQHAAEVAVIGHPYSAAMGWLYPPLFLFVAAGLACLPYAVAYAAWCLVTLAFHAGVTASIASSRMGLVGALAGPWVLLVLNMGQNGFFTAGILGLALLLLEDRPALAGLVLGLLSYKPQFGLLFPFALAAAGYWRAFAWAAVATVAWNGLAGTVFGFETLTAFAHSLSSTTQSHLMTIGPGGWRKFVSPFGFIRALNGSAFAAWAAQGAVSAASALGAFLAWRARIPFARKAALLAALVPLATPYVFVYDLPVLGVAIAFLFRDAEFDAAETAVLAATIPCVFAYLWLPIPTPLFASLAVAAIALRRWRILMPRHNQVAA